MCFKYTYKMEEFMTKKKTSITVSVPNNITQDEIKEIRHMFSQDPLSDKYKLNILISGHEHMQDILGHILVEKIRNVVNRTPL